MSADDLSSSESASTELTSKEEPSLIVEKSSASIWQRLLQLHGSAHSIALGTAIGLFVALTPTVGLQMIIILLISLVIPANRLAGFIMVYISNPLTMIPIYWVDYWVGLKCLAREGMSRADFEQRWIDAQALASEAGWYQGGLELLRSIGDDVLGPMFVGGAVVGLIFALPAYPVTLHFVQQYRLRKEQQVPSESCDKESNG